MILSFFQLNAGVMAETSSINPQLNLTRIEDLKLYNNPSHDIATRKPHLAINLSGGNEKHGPGIGPRFAGNVVECWPRDTTARLPLDSYL